MFHLKAKRDLAARMVLAVCFGIFPAVRARAQTYLAPNASMNGFNPTRLDMVLEISEDRWQKNLESLTASHWWRRSQGTSFASTRAGDITPRPALERVVRFSARNKVAHRSAPPSETVGFRGLAEGSAETLDWFYVLLRLSFRCRFPVAGDSSQRALSHDRSQEYAVAVPIQPVQGRATCLVDIDVEKPGSAIDCAVQRIRRAVEL